MHDHGAELRKNSRYSSPASQMIVAGRMHPDQLLPAPPRFVWTESGYVLAGSHSNESVNNRRRKWACDREVTLAALLLIRVHGAQRESYAYIVGRTLQRRFANGRPAVVGQTDPAAAALRTEYPATPLKACCVAEVCMLPTGCLCCFVRLLGEFSTFTKVTSALGTVLSRKDIGRCRRGIPVGERILT